MPLVRYRPILLNPLMDTRERCRKVPEKGAEKGATRIFRERCGAEKGATRIFRERCGAEKGASERWHLFRKTNRESAEIETIRIGQTKGQRVFLFSSAVRLSIWRLSSESSCPNVSGTDSGSQSKSISTSLIQSYVVHQVTGREGQVIHGAPGAT